MPVRFGVQGTPKFTRIGPGGADTVVEKRLAAGAAQVASAAIIPFTDPRLVPTSEPAAPAGPVARSHPLHGIGAPPNPQRARTTTHHPPPPTPGTDTEPRFTDPGAPASGPLTARHAPNR